MFSFQSINYIIFIVNIAQTKNNMKKKVLILGGGYSKERVISLKSSKAIIKSIKKHIK